MASEQLSRRHNTRTKEREIEVEKERVPQLTSHFEAIAVHQQGITEEKPSGGRKEVHSTSIAKGELPVREEEDETQRIEGGDETLHQLAKGKKEGEIETLQNQPSLEEISNFRAIAQERSNEAIRAAKERYDKANKESLNQGVGDKTEESQQSETKDAEVDRVEGEGQQSGLGTVKETLTSAAETAKDYTLPIAEKAKDYTFQKAVEAKDITVSAGQTTAHYLEEKVVAAKNVALESGKVAAEYAGKAAEDLKDKAVVAGWSTAHYSCDTAVEGTKAAARLAKGAAEYAGALAAKPLSAAKNVAESTGESVKEYTARKKEEAEREAMYKTGEKESTYERTKETIERGKEEVKERGEGKRVDDGGILGAIGETIYEIAQTTKEIVIGGGDETEKQSTLGFEVGEEEQYLTDTRKEQHRAS